MNDNNGYNPMTRRRALALAVMATQHIADENTDVTDWQRAAAYLRAMLAEARDPVKPWFVSVGNAGYRGGRHKSEYER